MEEKFCKFCGEKIAKEAVLCPHCGRQVEELKSSKADQPNVIINNSNMNSNANNTNTGVGPNQKNKWVALILCIFIGIFGAHKFYEGKIGMGVLYLFTGGLCGVGVIVDFITLLFKSNPYYV